jgi:hypothetical protein
MDQRERHLDRAVQRNQRSQPLLLQGTPIERWPLVRRPPRSPPARPRARQPGSHRAPNPRQVQKWTPAYLYELWDADEMPTLRRVRAQYRRRPDFVGYRHAAHQPDQLTS